MKTSKFTSNLFLILTIFLIALAIVITGLGLSSSPALLKSPPGITERVAAMLGAVHRNDYAAVSACIAGHPNMGVDREPANGVSGLVWQSFTDSFAYALQGEVYATDDGLAQDVDVEFLDISNLMTGLNERARELLEQRVRDAVRVQDVYDDNHEYREDVVMDVLREAVAEALEQRAEKIAARLTVHLVQQDDEWWVQMDSALLSAISGNTL